MKRLTRAFTYNWPLKLTALGLAILLWLFVTLKTNPWTVREFDATVEGRFLPEGLEVIAIKPAKVRVTLAGRRRRVDQVNPRLLRAIVNLRGRSVGDHEVPVFVSTGTLPGGVRVMGIATRSVVVSLDRTVEQKRAVKIILRGRPAPGFVAVDKRSRPNEVTVTGPQTAVQAVASAVAEVDISGIHGTRTFSCLLEARDARDIPEQGVKVVPSRADVEVIVERVNTKTVPVVLGEVELPAGRAIESIDVSPPVVTLTGKPAVLATVESVSVELVRVTDDTTVLRAELKLPPGVRAVGDDSVRISVQLTRARRPRIRRAPTPPATPTPEPEVEPPTPEPGEPGSSEPTPETGPSPEPPVSGDTTPPSPPAAPETPGGRGESSP